MLQKTEMKAKSLERTVDQKNRENEVWLRGWIRVFSNFGYFQELTTICDDLIAKVGTWQHSERDFSLTRARPGTHQSNLGAGNSRSQSHLDSGNCSRDRPSLQRQGTFTETRKSRPRSVEYSEYSDQYPHTATGSQTSQARARAGSGSSTSRPLSGPPTVRHSSDSHTVTRQTSTRLARQLSDSVATTHTSTRYRQTGAGTVNTPRSATTTRPHSHCYTRTSPSPTFARKYRGSPNRGRMIWRSLTF